MVYRIYVEKKAGFAHEASALKGDSDSNDSRVKARSMTWKQRGLLAAGCIIAVIAVGFILKYFDDPQPFKDSTTTVLSIVAQALMAWAFMEQWALWIITNVVSVAMWGICASRGDAHAGVMVLMWVFYLMNSLNGFRVWRRLAQE
jgi:nicotinamide mononucleotide transporter